MELLFLASETDPGAEAVAAALGAAGYVVRFVGRCAEAEHLLHTGAGEAMIADADLLDSDTLARLRRDRPAQPIICWLLRPSSDRAAELLEVGANEVIGADMGSREIGARVRATLRAAAAGLPGLVYGPLEIDEETGEARWDGSEVRLTRRERQVLQVLASAAGRTVRRDRLYRRVWGYAMARGDRSVDVNVKRLRAKLAAATGGRLEITTQPGVGYRLELPDTERAAEPESATVTTL